MEPVQHAPRLSEMSPSRADLFAEPAPSKTAKRILAVASGGGHWVQLCRLMPAFAGHDIAFLTTHRSNYEDVPNARFYCIRGASLWNKFGLIRMCAQVLWIVMHERPDVVISTGAAPGYLALRFGKWFGAKTIWLDSIANVDTLSVSGKHVQKCADIWLTQWPQLAKPQGPLYVGAVL